jgi:hypothetical protein
MKHYTLTLALLLGISHFSVGQIVMEQSYSIFKPSTTSKQSGLTLIRLDISGDKYLFYDIISKKIKLYNMNNSLFKIISIPHLPRYRSSNTDSTVSIAYISENLFNSDNLIEFVSFDGSYSAGGGAVSAGSMRIFNEQGNIIFNGDSLMPTQKRTATWFGYDGDSDFIFNTSSGTKMFLYSYKNNSPSQVVYSLPGSLVASIKNEEIQQKNILPYPNPTSDKITIAYKLDNNKEGKLIITDLNGRSLLEYKIDNVFDNVIIDTKSLLAGSYYYTIYSSEKKLTSGKFMVTN